MRLYVSILAVAALSTAACGKKADPAKPEPAKTEEPAKAEAPKEEPTKEEPTAEVPADRVELVQKAIEAWAAGKPEEAYATFADDAVRYQPGNPEAAELKGKQTIIDAAKAQLAMMSDVKMKAARIIESGNTMVVEYVFSGNMKVKGADGAETMKPVTVPGAFLVEFNAEGKATAMWDFYDQANMMMQAGMIPGLAEGFTAVAMPETTEVIKGEANPAHAELYKTFGEKMTPDTIEAAVAEHIADDYTMVDFMTGKTITKADFVAAMKQWMGMFADTEMKTDKDLSVGEYYVTVSKSTGTYKGGIPGAEANDQKVTMTEMAVSRIVDGKFKSWAGYMNGMELAAQLGMLGGAAEKPAEEPKAEEPAAAGEGIGVPECDLYVAKMTECVGALPDAAKGAFESGMKTALDGWKQSIAAGGDAAKQALSQACKTTLDAAKQAAGQLCPNVKWE